MSVTVIRNLDWTIAWDAASASHVYKRGIDVAFDGANLIHVGPAYAGKADKSGATCIGWSPRRWLLGQTH